MDIIKHSVKRYNSSTPPFFKKLSRMFKGLAVIIATATTALYALPSDVTNAFPVGLLKYIGITVFVSTLIGYLMAELTTDNKEVQDEQYK